MLVRHDKLKREFVALFEDLRLKYIIYWLVNLGERRRESFL